jgi:hypothetical protein
VRLLAEKSYGVAFYTLCAEDYTKGKLKVFENRALLDVQFEIGCCISLLFAGVSYLIDIEATLS